MNKIIPKAVWIVVCVSLTGCTVFRHPAPKIDVWRKIPDRPPETPIVKPSSIQQGWVNDFDDDQLASLIIEALANNYDLHAAAASLEASIAVAKNAGADRYPTLSADVGASRTKRTSSSGFQISNPRTSSYDAGLRFDWELDAWGKIRARSRAAQMETAAEGGLYQSLRLSLAINTAKAWFNAIEARLQLELSERERASFLQTHDIIAEQFENGIRDALDLRLAKVDLANARQRVAQRRVNSDSAIRSLEVLVGRYPSAELKASQTLPTLKQEIPTGLPAEMLERRPDIHAALRKIDAATLRVRERRKALLPGIKLAATGGTSGGNFKDIFNRNRNIWSLSGDISQVIFEGGRRLAWIDETKAREKEEVANLAQLVLEACRDLETATAAERFLGEKEHLVTSVLDESTKAYQLAIDRYVRGLTDVTTLLLSQRSEFGAERLLLETKLKRLQNRLDLYLAMGGEFQTNAEPNSN